MASSDTQRRRAPIAPDAEKGKQVFPRRCVPGQRKPDARGAVTAAFAGLRGEGAEGLLRQMSSFAGVGFAATAVHYALLILLVEFAHAGAPPAALAGSVAGALFSYALNRRHTFRSDAPHARAGARFALVAAGAAALTYGMMSLLVNGLGAPYLPAQAATTGVVALWTFAAHRFWTFA